MAEEQQRELCPSLTTTKDLVDQIGALSVDILNKEKVLLELWKNIDELTVSVKSLTEEVNGLNNIKLNQEKTLESNTKEIERLKSKYNEADRKNREEVSSLLSVHSIKMNEKNSEVRQLNKTLKGIEAEAVINQEEVRKELMETRNELSALKESIKSKPKRAKKKKTSAKPARA